MLSGPAEIEEFFAGLFENGVAGRALRVIEVGGDGKLVYGAAHWTATAKRADGPPQEIGGTATPMVERQGDGGLKLNLHAFN